MGRLHATACDDLRSTGFFNTMKLYHYIATSMGETMLSEGLNKGHLLHGDDTIRQDLVSFTTASSFEHHGLTLGTDRPSA